MTLIELIITIAIMAVLLTTGISVFATVQKNNRDHKRFRDLSAVKQALELYRNNYGVYPGTLDRLVPDYMDQIPSDPLTQWGYRYFASATTFVYCAAKEGVSSFSLPSGCNSLNCTGVDSSCTMGVSSD
ncbi:type II secretion system protein [Candidatus Daviesbacteria bacterium]|nr:type II secretion system protein [Candidatus Daviesbacteria bacterium]